MAFLMIETVARVAIDQGIIAVIKTLVQKGIIHGKVVVFVILQFLFAILREEERAVAAVHSTKTKAAASLFLVARRAAVTLQQFVVGAGLGWGLGS
jgi:hypothetical protein